MKNNEKLKIYSLEELTDKHLGKRGTAKREVFEQELQLELLEQAIRQARLERNLTQEELGKLVGVKKAQISKIENSLTDARFETIIKVFKALNAKVNFNVELLNQTMQIA
jgi:DNA-binding XRE family transcriptional regulator